MSKYLGVAVVLAVVLLPCGVGHSEDQPPVQPAGGAVDFSVDGNGNVTASSFTGDGSGLTNLAADPSPWFVCGNLSDLVGCELPDFPNTDYEYGAAFLTPPIPYTCTNWNRGRRVYNKQPFFVTADNPETGMQYGGVVFYRDTDATDDDICGASGTWRHQYWRLDYTDANLPVKTIGGLGCLDQVLYCRMY